MTKLIPICLLVTGGVLFADDWNKRTEVTLGQPVIVAGVPVVTLEPGKYVFRLLNSQSDRHIVQIFNEQEDKLFTTVLAIPNYRLKPTDNTALEFYETPAGNPVALHAWFWPGDNFGQEFVYPTGLAAKIAKETGEPVLATPAETEPELAAAPVVEINKEGEEQPVEEAAIAPEEPAPAAPTEVAENAEALPLIGREQTPETLPATATPLYTIGLMGALILSAGLGLRYAAARAR